MRRRLLALLMVAALAAAALFTPFNLEARPATPRGLEIKVLGQTQFLAGSAAALRIITYDGTTRDPIGSVPVVIRLVGAKGEETPLASGLTNRLGTLDASFPVPRTVADGTTLVVDAGTGAYARSASTPILVKAGRRLYLSTDKPLYQPGQVIHLRLLGLGVPAMEPLAGEPCRFEVRDGKGNLVFRSKGPLSKYGVASDTFQLASEVNMGTYQITAAVGDAQAERSVTVKKYRLPPFKIDLKTDAPYYRPGDTLHLTVTGTYLFGKPVAAGRVVLKAASQEAGDHPIGEMQGKMSADGAFKWELALPDYFVGQSSQDGNGAVSLEAAVTDAAGHTETRTLSVPIAREPLTADLFAEAGSLKPGVPNAVYLVMGYPDNSPYQGPVTVTAQDKSWQLTTDAAGTAEFTVTPSSSYTLEVDINAKDRQGNQADLHRSISAGWQEGGLLVRPDQALYSVGGRATITVLSSDASGTVYLDLVRNRQTVLTKAVTLQKGRGEVTLDLTPDVAGLLTIHAYQAQPHGDWRQDARSIFVSPDNDLTVRITADQPEYRPGQDAVIRFQVTGKDGRPAPSVLGVDIIDEGVLAVAEASPGLARVAFLLEEELMTPRYEVHGFTMEESVTMAPDDQPARQRLSQILFSKIPQPETATFTVDTYAQRLSALQTGFSAVTAAAQRWRSSGNEGAVTARDLVDAGFLNEDAVRDPWGTPYRIAMTQGYPQASSAGPDGAFGTPDDMTQERCYQALQERGLGGGFFAMDQGIAFGAAGMPVMEEKAMEMPAPGPENMARKAAISSVVATAGAAPPLAVRDYFPETLYTNPAVVTGDDGVAEIRVPMADSITTWQVSAFASSLHGELGSGLGRVKVFQDFFVDADLPVALTQGDEVTVPVAIYNYQQAAQSVSVTLEPADWFTLDGAATRKVALAAGAVGVARFRVTLRGLGDHTLTVRAQGGQLTDAVRRPVEVLPSGREFLTTVSRKVADSATITAAIPNEAVPGASRILVTIYPGILAQVVKGLDQLLRMPSGCFEQTSSTTYPNVLVVRYLKAQRKISPEISMKAEGYINTGYQRLISFEVAGGGYSWFGDAPANKILTAFGVMQFHDMAEVQAVDPAIIPRAVAWLASQQNKDGSWAPDAAYLHQDSWSRIQNSHLPVTAYIVWALAEGGQQDLPAVRKGLAYLREHWRETHDAYILALTANAFLAADPKGKAAGAATDALMALRKTDGETAWWPTGLSTATYSTGPTAAVETTALATYAALQAEGREEIANAGIAWLLKQKDPYGTWGSTQATILTMKALLLSQKRAVSAVDGTAQVRLNGGDAQTVTLSPETSELFHQIDLGAAPRSGANAVEIRFEGKGGCYAQVTTRYYLPWQEAAQNDPLGIAVTYDRTTLSQNDLVLCQAAVTNRTKARADMVMVDLGIPPGFQVQAEDLDGLVARGVIKKYGLTARQVLVYLDHVAGGSTVKLAYHLKAALPIRAHTPPSAVYKYYAPEIRSEAAPVMLEVSN